MDKDNSVYTYIEAQLEKLTGENSQLKEQVKRLLKTESELYNTQRKLDFQLDLYRKLYEASKAMSVIIDTGKILDIMIHVAIYDLGFERCIIFLFSEDRGVFSVKALDGFYDEDMKKSVSMLTFTEDDPVLAGIFSSENEFVCCGENQTGHYLDFAGKIGMDEYAVFIFHGEEGRPMGLLITGNTSENGEFHTKIEYHSDALMSLFNLSLQASESINIISYLSELKGHRNNLEDLVTERTRELDEANRSLRQEIREREDAERQLRIALEKIKTMEGILPICSHCKKIRDDSGAWNQIETYVRDHSNAEFSHSICPDCMKNYYPEMKDKIERE